MYLLSDGEFGSEVLLLLLTELILGEADLLWLRAVGLRSDQFGPLLVLIGSATIRSVILVLMKCLPWVTLPGGHTPDSSP